MPSQNTPYSHFEPASAPFNPRHAAIGGFAVGGFLAFAAALAALVLYCDPQIQTQAVTVETAPTAHKFAVDFSTPVELQEYRGTCWIFAAVAVLEWSYRSQGVARGWLGADQYVRLSEQAFGVAVLDACRALNDGTSCVVGDETAALPWSVCPYTAKPGSDGECPGLAEARATNPLTFSLASIDWLYERRAVTQRCVGPDSVPVPQQLSFVNRRAVTQRLRETQRLMTLSTPLLTVRYLLPCTAASAHVLKCNPKDKEECRVCPAEPAFGGAACCVVSERDSSTMGGEFFRLPSGSHLEPVLEGAHAMALVGYSDVFRSQQGFVGGYIVKNSWWDGLPPGPGWKQARGSHSVAFFMQQVSPADEAAVCPNAH
ncbi:hypothetical protein EMIHUDRAFT_452176, partial [Emiliania huxleyi CCMP1516]|uniref:Peptidase C1A papain C-terminal domain-containing protein n=2 Tax=Emiliania huxleyi TaxID=2903 RepID=A0A0D3IN68_EMIH1